MSGMRGRDVRFLPWSVVAVAVALAPTGAFASGPDQQAAEKGRVIYQRYCGAEG